MEFRFCFHVQVILVKTATRFSPWEETFGGFGVIEIPNLQGLLRHICENGYEHHVAANRSEVAASIADAFSSYLGWSVYQHEA